MNVLGGKLSVKRNLIGIISRRFLDKNDCTLYVGKNDSPSPFLENRETQVNTKIVSINEN